MATAPQRQAYAITCPACGTRPRRASSSEAAPAPVPNPPSTQPMPEAPQPRSSASRVSPTLSGPTNPRSPRAMASISGARTRWRRMWRSPARRSCQAVPSAFLSSAGSSRIRTATSSGTDIAISAPARANAAAAPPAATARPPSGPPTTLANRMPSPRMPCTRASCPRLVTRAGRAPTAGMNTASTVPKARASTASGHSPGPVKNSSPATASTAAQRTASLAMTTLRGPSRSAITPPPSMSRARGRALTAMTRPACAGEPACTAAQDRAM